MKTKEVILFIVEGATDKESLGGIINELIQSKSIAFHITCGDITSDFYSKPSNIVSKVHEHIKHFLNTNGIGIRKKDIRQIVHLIDTDGTYVDSEQIQVNANLNEFVYTESAIVAKSKEKVIERNDRKKLNVDRLAFCPKIATIPYCMYYFSCNLEHVLHDEINVPDEEKTEYAQDFSDQYEGIESEFVDFIRDGQFAVKGEYRETWEFIRRNGNSLKRFCNFHLFFQDIVHFNQGIE